MSKAVVLSGGGSVGIAWQSGVAAGLAAEGVDLSRADFIVGTSAGSAVGAQIALGRDMSEAIERYPRPEARSAPASAPRRFAAPSPERLQKLMEVMAKSMAPGGNPAEGRAAIGRFALEAETPPEERFIEGFRYLAGEGWPRGFACTAVDAESGAFVVWDEAAGVDLAAAVASSCAVPGLFSPITIKGRRYIDGGMRSGTNADLAKGHDKVLLLTLMRGDRAQPVDAAAAERMKRFRRSAEGELSALRESGSSVETLAPNPEAASIMGMNLMDPSIAFDAAQAGLRQGRAEADRIRRFWG